MNRSDPRSQRSRSALLQAFFALVVARPYREITVGVVIQRAGVARSTFYEHFRSKDELLAASLHGPFGVLADAVTDTARLAPLTQILEHFWSNRGLATAILKGALGRRAGGVLTQLVEQRLRAFEPLRIPSKLAAVQLAGLLLWAVGAWLEGVYSVSADDLARSLSASSQAARSALQVQAAAG
jgi:AcrR family transcriptional regulator